MVVGLEERIKAFPCGLRNYNVQEPSGRRGWAVLEALACHLTSSQLAGQTRADPARLSLELWLQVQEPPSSPSSRTLDFQVGGLTNMERAPLATESYEGVKYYITASMNIYDHDIFFLATFQEVLCLARCIGNALATPLSVSFPNHVSPVLMKSSLRKRPRPPASQASERPTECMNQDCVIGVTGSSPR
jgi:hypothetical protein